DSVFGNQKNSRDRTPVKLLSEQLLPIDQIRPGQLFLIQSFLPGLILLINRYTNDFQPFVYICFVNFLQIRNFPPPSATPLCPKIDQNAFFILTQIAVGVYISIPVGSRKGR